MLNHVYIKEFVTRAPFGFPAKSQDITRFSTLFFQIPKFLTKKSPILGFPQKVGFLDLCGFIHCTVLNDTPSHDVRVPDVFMI